jgi:DNA-directed RNA polymerase subunit RPC12/RpoP
MKTHVEKSEVFDACPHCGHELSPWEKVLLSVDRALMCRHCWYRILLDKFEPPAKGEDKREQSEK